MHTFSFRFFFVQSLLSYGYRAESFKFLCIHQVLQALDDQDRTAVHDSVNAFELAYATAQERDCWLACSGLAWMVSLAGRKQADGQLVASYLLRHWPASAEVTGRVVSERLALMVGRSLDWDYFCGAPLSFSRGKGLILMVCKKCCKKAMRYFSSLLRSRR